MRERLFKAFSALRCRLTYGGIEVSECVLIVEVECLLRPCSRVALAFRQRQRPGCLHDRLRLSTARRGDWCACNAEAPVIGPVAAQARQVCKIDAFGSFTHLVER